MDPVNPNSEPADELRLRADRIVALILSSDYPTIDIEIQIANLRRWCRDRLPNRLELFEMVYVSRFRRLLAQFRGKIG